MRTPDVLRISDPRSFRAATIVFLFAAGIVASVGAPLLYLITYGYPS